MKLILSLCICAGALAVAPPRIELELSSLARPARLASSVYRSGRSFSSTGQDTRDTSYHATSASAYTTAPQGNWETFNRHDWSQHCTVLGGGQQLTNADCPLPVAKAYDHLEKNLSSSITTKIYRVDDNNQPCYPNRTDACEVTVNEIDYGKRSTFVFKYDVEDTSGNKAEQVVFVLVIDDQCGENCWPTISICGDSSESWEAAGDRTLCDTGATTAWDTLPQETLNSNLKYTIHRINIDSQGVQTIESSPECPETDYSDMTCANQKLTTTICSDNENTCPPESFLVTFKVCDNANAYGPLDNAGNPHDNCVTANKVITISDNTKPIITVTGWGAPPGTSLLWECNANTNVARSDCSKQGDYLVSGRTTPADLADDCGWHGDLTKSQPHCQLKATGWTLPKYSGDICKQITTQTACDADSECEWAEKVHHDSGDFHLGSHSSAYHDNGAIVYDKLDTDKDSYSIDFTSGSLSPGKYTVTQSPVVNTAQLGDYVVTYNAEDRAGNQAVPKTRNIKVVDTSPPTVKLDDFEFVSGIHENAENSSNIHQTTTIHNATEELPLWEEPEWHCIDSCDTTGDAMKLTPEWDRPWNDRVVGDYYRTYTCNDTSGNSHSAVRRFTVQDNVKPQLRIMGAQTQTIEATLDQEYTDQGAMCHDYVDGVLSHAVEVSGQVVNMRVPGNYTIQYDCQDLSGNAATPMHRIIYIVDTTPPVISMKGETPIYIEAGFPYVDAGAKATDTLDGDLTDFITKDGDTVNDANAFHSARSCREILKAADSKSITLQSGMYFITVWVGPNSAYKRLLVHCDMDSTIGGNKVGFTYHHYTSPTGTPVVPYGSAAGECAKVGLEMVDFTGKEASCNFIKSKYAVDFPTNFNCATGHTTESSATYLCGTNDELGARLYAKHKNNALMDELIRDEKTDISRAEAGVFVIYYHVTDNAGNTEVQPSPARTVIVKDTLPPVISLHLSNGTAYHNIQTSHTIKDINDVDKQGLLYNEFSNNEAVTQAPRAVANPATVSDVDGGGNPWLKSSYQPTGADVTPNNFASPSESAAKMNTYAVDNGGQSITYNGYDSYMAEERASSANGWVIGAAASAIAGLALLAYSRRQQSRLVTVDV